MSFTDVRRVVVLYLLSGALALRAQVVRGIALDVGGAPVSGAVVQLLESDASITNRSLSNERGEFRLFAQRAGVYRLRILRIGYRPTLSERFPLSLGDEIVRNIQATGLIVALDTVRVGARRLCSLRAADSIATVYSVWEQARIALSATQLTAGNRDMLVSLLAFERVLDPTGARVVRESKEFRSDSVAQPWFSLPVETLRKLGYVSSEGDSTIYRAPGIDMLSSDSFLDDHCFRLVLHPADQSRLGIEFEPNSARSKVAEIKGTLWLDRTTSALRTIEYSYVNTRGPKQQQLGGGTAEFAKMSNGAWVITSWFIRMPDIALAGLEGGRDFTIRVPTLLNFRVTGRELVLAQKGDDTLWARRTVNVGGQVRDSVTNQPVMAARLKLQGTRVAAMTDSSGRFTLRGALPGAYLLEIRTPSLDSMTAVERVPLTVTDGTASIPLRVSSAQTIASAMCGAAVGRGIARLTGIIEGRVLISDDSIASRRGTVIAEWVEGVDRQQRWLETNSDSLGRFRLCGVPLDATIALRAINSVGSSPQVVTELSGGTRIGRVSLTVDRALSGGAVFTGIVVVDSTLEPITGAEVVISGLNRAVRTGASGRFRFDGIPAGDHTVTVRKLGFGPASATIAFGALVLSDEDTPKDQPSDMNRGWPTIAPGSIAVAVICEHPSGATAVAVMRCVALDTNRTDDIAVHGPGRIELEYRPANQPSSHPNDAKRPRSPHNLGYIVTAVRGHRHAKPELKCPDEDRRRFIAIAESHNVQCIDLRRTCKHRNWPFR